MICHLIYSLLTHKSAILCLNFWAYNQINKKKENWMGWICLQNIPLYKGVKILGGGGQKMLIFLKTAITKMMSDLKGQETATNQPSQIFFENKSDEKSWRPLLIWIRSVWLLLGQVCVIWRKKKKPICMLCCCPNVWLSAFHYCPRGGSRSRHKICHSVCLTVHLILAQNCLH